MRIAVCRPQIPFMHGGAEIFTDRLVEELRARGHDAEIVSVPFKTWPNRDVLKSALLWRLVDLHSEPAQRADLVIATKFPSYLVQHPNKVVWLVHQLRQAYELEGTEYGQLSDSADDRSVRDTVRALDREALGDARRIFATSANVADRLVRSTGLAAEVMPHPPQELAYRCDRYDPFVLSVGRLDAIKRVDLLLRAAAGAPALRIVIAGGGPEREPLEALATELALGERVLFAGRVPEDELATLYATCRAVYYAPVDEDFGMVPFEAFRAAKPVVTTTDAGGPLEVVVDGATGVVCEPDVEPLAAALRRLADDERLARRLGEAGRAATAHVDWGSTIDRLLAC